MYKAPECTDKNGHLRKGCLQVPQYTPASGTYNVQKNILNISRLSIVECLRKQRLSVECFLLFSAGSQVFLYILNKGSPTLKKSQFKRLLLLERV